MGFRQLRETDGVKERARRDRGRARQGCLGREEAGVIVPPRDARLVASRFGRVMSCIRSTNACPFMARRIGCGSRPAACSRKGAKALPGCMSVRISRPGSLTGRGGFRLALDQSAPSGGDVRRLRQPRGKFHVLFDFSAVCPDAETFRRIQPFFILAVRCGEARETQDMRRFVYAAAALMMLTGTALAQAGAGGGGGAGGAGGAGTGGAGGGQPSTANNPTTTAAPSTQSTNSDVSGRSASTSNGETKPGQNTR
jgi:hypothetical protein